jgi:hypothetical protein
MMRLSSARAGVWMQSPAVRNARTHKPDERQQVFDKAAIKPSSRSLQQNRRDNGRHR